ncbi:MAG: MFS transporter [Alphaproteobacteria bacterium]|nr:MAG: MFS transporter [Alphaproteobacteria bacterium]
MTIKQTKNRCTRSSQGFSSALPKQTLRIYRFWRLRILSSVVFGYATYYIVRANFAIAMPSLVEEGYSKAQLGDMLFWWSLVYGVGKVVNGYWSDRSNARYFMGLGLLGAGLMSVGIALTTGTFFLISCLLISSWFQSMGWPASARMLTHWFARKELGIKWALGACSHQVGAAFIMIVGAYLVQNYGWRSAFLVPGVLAIAVSFYLLACLRDNPTEVNLPTVEVYKNDYSDVTSNTFHGESGERPNQKEIWKMVFANKMIWYVCFANMFLYIVRMGVLQWAPTFLKEFKGVNLLEAGHQAAGYELAGLMGGLVAGWLSDTYFKGQRGPVATVYMVALMLAMLAFWQTPPGYYYVDMVTLACVGFFVYGPQILAGVASADFASKHAVGTANGLVGAFASLGSALSGAVVGRISDTYGWNGGFIFFISAAALGAVAFGLTGWELRRTLTQ